MTKRLHEIFTNVTVDKEASGDSFGERDFRELVRKSMDSWSGLRFPSKGVKRKQNRRATTIARMVFERSDYDCSNSIEFNEFIEFVVTLICANFLVLSTESEEDRKQRVDLSGFVKLLVRTFGDDVLLKSHEKKYQGRARQKIMMHKARQWLRNESVASSEDLENLHLDWEQSFDLLLSKGAATSLVLFKTLETSSITSLRWKDAQRHAHATAEKAVASAKRMGLVMDTETG